MVEFGSKDFSQAMYCFHRVSQINGVFLEPNTMRPLEAVPPDLFALTNDHPTIRLNADQGASVYQQGRLIESVRFKKLKEDDPQNELENTLRRFIRGKQQAPFQPEIAGRCRIADADE